MRADYDHHPSASILGATETTLMDGDGARNDDAAECCALGATGGLYGLCIELQTPLDANCARVGLSVTGVTERLSPLIVLARESGRGGGLNAELLVTPLVITPFDLGTNTGAMAAAALALAKSVSARKRAICSSSEAT